MPDGLKPHHCERPGGEYCDVPICYHRNVTKITQMVPEYSPQRGNP